MQPLRLATSTLLICLAAWTPAVAGATTSADQDLVGVWADLKIDSQHEQVSPLEQSLLDDAAAGRLDECSLLEAALIAEGVSDRGELDRLLNEFDRWAGRLGSRQALPVDANDRELAADVLEFLHGQLLLRGPGYDSDCSRMSEALEGGAFNCVSATLLFNCLAAELGLDAVAVEVPGHVFSRVVSAEQEFDVETTCRSWFARGEAAARRAELPGRGIHSRDETDGVANPGRVLTDAQLLAIIYYNRGVHCLSRRQFAQAFGAFRRAAALDPESSSIRGNLLAAVNNWALDLSGHGRFQQAVDLLERGRRAAPEHRSFEVNYAAVLQAWLESLYAEHNFETAVSIIRRAAETMPDEPFFRVAWLDAHRRWGRRLILDDHSAAATALFDRMLGPLADASDVRAVEAAALNDAALEFLAEHDFQAAIALLGLGCRRQPANPLLADNYRAAVMHWADDAFARGDYAEAVRRTHVALARTPDDAALRGNVRYGYHRWLAQLESAGQHAVARGVLDQARLGDPHSPLWEDWSARLMTSEGSRQ